MFYMYFSLSAYFSGLSKTVCVNLFSKDGKVKMKSAQHWDLEPKSFRAASLKIPGILEFAALKIEHLSLFKAQNFNNWCCRLYNLFAAE